MYTNIVTKHSGLIYDPSHEAKYKAKLCHIRCIPTSLRSIVALNMKVVKYEGSEQAISNTRFASLIEIMVHNSRKVISLAHTVLMGGPRIRYHIPIGYQTSSV
jgi:hypothetical protein